jgi:hypothetical protein
VGKMVARFAERGEWCSHLESSGSRVCDLILVLADGQVALVTRLEEAVGQFCVMQDEHQALQRSATRVSDLVVEGSSEAPSLAAELSLATDLIEDHIDATAANNFLWGGPAGVDCHLVTLPQTRARVRVAGVQV